MLDIDAVLDTSPAVPLSHAWLTIGRSRAGRALVGFELGDGDRKVSLIAGCHADEPVGPAMLDRLVAWLAKQPPASPLLADFTWVVIPHINPDGEALNRAWTTALGDPRDWARAEPPVTADVAAYLKGVRRERPGDDVEFGFPRGPDDAGARPENRAAAEFLAEHGPYALHASFHGMSFAAGPWFLLEPAWEDRTLAMRDELRGAVADAGYEVHDVDRGGDKGFRRIDRGFTTRPDSVAMAAHFRERGDAETAALFRPSSMEYVRSLGGDPLTLVSEMPLFLVPANQYQAGTGDPLRPAAVAELSAVAAGGAADDAVREHARQAGIRPMPLRDQMRFQLAYLDAALRTVSAAPPR